MVNRLREFWRLQKRDAPFLGPLLDQLQDRDSELSRSWDREHDQHVLQKLLAQLEPDFAPTTWESFRLLLAGEDPQTIAASLGISPNSVFLNKSRILKRLREMSHDLTD